MSVFRLTRRKSLCTWTRPRAWLSSQWKSYEAVRGRLIVRFLGRRWQGLFVLAVVKNGRERYVFDGVRSYLEVGEMKKKKIGVSKDGPVHLAPMESEIFSKMGSIPAHMATLRYEDGDPRKPGEFRIRPAGAMWCAEALDYDARCQLQCIAATLDDAVVGLSLLLEQEDAPWQQCPWMKEPAAPRKKK